MPSLNLAFVTHFYSTEHGRSDAAGLPDQVASFQIDYSFPLAQGYVCTAGKEKGMHFYLASLKSLVSKCPFSGHPVCLTLQPHQWQHARLFCPSSPNVCSNSFLLSCWCPPIISSSVIPFSSCLHSFQHQDLFQWVGPSHQMAKYWSFSISPSSEYSGLISCRIDWFDLLAVQGTLKSLLQHHSLKASILWHSAFFMVQLSYPYMTIEKKI